MVCLVFLSDGFQYFAQLVVPCGDIAFCLIATDINSKRKCHNPAFIPVLAL